MFCLAYKSTASTTFGYDDIQPLLDWSRNWNKENGVTGCLLYYQGKFLQYIEGNEETILALFDMIKSDARHSGVTLLAYESIIERVFPNWEMAYQDFEEVNHQLQYLKLVAGLYSENPNTSLTGNPTSKSFWTIVHKILIPKSSGR